MMSGFVWFVVVVVGLIGAAVGSAFVLDLRARRSGTPRLTAEELAGQLEILAASEGWDQRGLVDELDCVPIRDQRLDGIRERVVEMLDENMNGDSWFSPAHREELRALAMGLRSTAPDRTGA